MASVMSWTSGGVRSPSFVEVVGAQDVEHLDERDASGGGWRRADDLVTVIGAFDRNALPDLVVGEVGFGDQAAVGLHVGGELLRDLAVVEVAGIGGDALQGGGELGLAKGVAGLVIRTSFRVGLEDSVGLGELGQVGIVQLSGFLAR